MKRTVGTALTAVVLIAGATSTAIAGTRRVELSPSSPWNVDYSDKACTLKRAFGTGNQSSELQLRKYAPSDMFELIAFSLLWKRVTLNNRAILKGKDMVLEPSYHPRFFSDSTKLDRPDENVPTLFFKALSLREYNEDQPFPATQITPEMEKNVNSVTIQRHGKDLILKTGPLDKAFAVMRDCTDNLLMHWGLDPKVQKERSQEPQPIGSPGNWVTDKDYPKDNSSSGKQGLVHFRLLVDAAGNVTNCAILKSYNDQKFDDLTCSLISKRAKFQPAIDKFGTPIPSYYVNTVSWVIS